MKLLKKILILVLVFGVAIGIVGGVREIGEIRERRDQKGTGGLGGQEATEKPLRFAVMADIHSDWGNFRKVLEQAKEEFGPASAEPDSASARQGFVIITGDLTTLGKKSELLEAKKILDESELKYYVVPGNHDIWWGREYKKDVWKEVFGSSFLSFKEDGVKFILINNADGVGGFRGFGDIAGQMIWLENEAKECLKIYCLVFMHMPLNHPNSLHVMGEDNPKVASEARELIRLFVADKIKQTFAGHLHFSSSYEIDGLKTTIVGAVTSERNAQSPKFLEVSFDGISLNKEDVFLSDSVIDR